MQPLEVTQIGNHLVMPGMTTAHSHAFQRALRGRTQRKPTTASSFWSWRGLMYELANKIDPDDIYHISRFAFAELVMSGVTAVGEFHYVHHQKGGLPYDNRTILADSVIRAAQDVGIRITLIRTAYFRGGFQQNLEPEQLRFSDRNTDLILKDVETLKSNYRDSKTVRVALAAHSIRAVPLAQILELSGFAKQNKLPFHMHVSEQRRELKECQAEYQKTPVELLAEHGILDKKFIGVHATHLSENEIKALGESNAFVCLCRTTERDLGDGLAPTRELIDAGAKICVGVDSHAAPDAFEEIRAVELDERLRTETRTTAAEAPALLKIATSNGLQAIGMPVAELDSVYLNLNDPSITDAEPGLLVDAAFFGGIARAVERVVVAGREIVSNGRHVDYPEIRSNYLKTLKKLLVLKAD